MNSPINKEMYRIVNSPGPQRTYTAGVKSGCLMVRNYQHLRQSYLAPKKLRSTLETGIAQIGFMQLI